MTTHLDDLWQELPRLDDPYPALTVFREEAPVYHAPDGTWFVTRYQLVNSIVRDSQLWSSDHRRASGAGVDPYLHDPNHGIFSRIYETIIMFQDGDAHRRLRRLSQPIFTPKRMEAFRSRVRLAIDRQLDEVLAQGPPVDLTQAFLLPMPTRIILDMIGMPGEESRFSEMTHIIVPPLERESPDDWIAHADEVFGRHKDFIVRVARERAALGSDDLLTEIANADGDPPLTDDELVGFVSFLVTAGYETTANSLGNGILWLLRNPDQLQALVEDRSLLGSAVEEILRYDVATRNTGSRFATTETELEGLVIRRGERVLPSIHAANRDPRVFDHADDFDIRRSPNRHLSFSNGPHACLGMALARIELQEGLDAALDRLPDLRACDAASWLPSRMIRGLRQMEVSWS